MTDNSAEGLPLAADFFQPDPASCTLGGNRRTRLSFLFAGCTRGAHHYVQRRQRRPCQPKCLQAWANNLIACYGRVQELKIDSRLKTIAVTCVLEGEATPITVRIENYVVETERDKKMIRATGFSCTASLAAKRPDGFRSEATDRAAPVGGGGVVSVLSP